MQNLTRLRVRKALVILAGTTLAIHCFGQGQVTFRNTSTRAVTNSVTGLKVEPKVAVAGLYFNKDLNAVPSPGIPADDFRLAATTPIAPTAAFAGVYSGGTVAIPGAWGGSEVILQVRAWSVGYTNYEEAFLAGALIGASNPMRVELASDTPIPNISLLVEGFSIAPALVPPSIIEQPQNQTVSVGGEVILSVRVVGSVSLFYQWRKDGVDLEGANRPALNLIHIQISDGGDYSVVLTNMWGAVTSTVATVTVLPTQGTVVFANAPSSAVLDAATGLPLSNDTAVAGLYFSTDLNAMPNLAVALDGFRLAATTPILGAFGGGLYDGGTVGLPGPVPGQEVILQVRAWSVGHASYEEAFRADARVGASNPMRLTLGGDSFAVPSLSNYVQGFSIGPVPVLPNITEQPRSQTVYAGFNVTFSVKATGSVPLSYQWRKDGTDLAGANSPDLTLTQVQTNDAGRYWVVVSSAVGSVTSAAATLTVTLDTITEGRVVFRNSATNAVTDRSTGLPLTPGTTIAGLYFSTNLEAFPNPSLPEDGFQLVATTPIAPSAAYRGIYSGGTVPIPGTLPGQEVILQVRAWRVGVGYHTYGDAFRANAFVGASNPMRVALGGLMDPPNLQYIVQGFSVGPRPVWPSVTEQPQTQMVFAGLDATLAVTVTGTEPLFYRWHKDGLPLAGANHSVLTLTNVQLSDAGGYSVLVTNVAGATTSVVASLRVIAPNNWVVSTFAGSGAAGFLDTTNKLTAQFNSPNGLVYSPAFGLFVADSLNHVIRQIDAGGVTTWAGIGTQGTTLGPADLAQFRMPLGLGVDSLNQMIVADTENHRILRIASFGDRTVSLLAGSGTAGLIDGHGTGASFNFPVGCAVDAHENAFIADFNNHVIREVTPLGEVTVFAGNGWPGRIDGTGTAAQFLEPAGLAINGEGLLYVSEWGGHRIRKITPGGVVTTMAGARVSGFQDGLGTAALLARPSGICVDAWGNLLVVEQGNHAVRRVTPAGEVTTIAGSGVAGYQDGVGTEALFNAPWDIVALPDGSFLISDSDNNRIRKLEFFTGPPVLEQQPVSTTNGLGDTALFSVSVSTAGIHFYQWSKDGVEIAGATNASYMLVNAQTNDSGRYRVVVSNAYGTVASDVVTLLVAAPPEIISQPVSQTAGALTNLALSVEVVSPLEVSYQWRFSGEPIPGATGSIYLPSGGPESVRGFYDVIVCHPFGCATSASVRLTLWRIRLLPVVTLDGEPGTTGRIEHREEVGATNWTFFTNVVVPSSGHLAVPEESGPDVPKRFYRFVRP